MAFCLGRIRIHLQILCFDAACWFFNYTSHFIVCGGGLAVNLIRCNSALTRGHALWLATFQPSFHASSQAKNITVLTLHNPNASNDY